MKGILKLSAYSLFVLIILASGCKPPPAPPPVKKNTITAFSTSGVNVLFKASNNDVVSARVVIHGGTGNYSPEQQGIEALALRTAIEGGTQMFSAAQFNNELEKIGAHITVEPGLDYSSVVLKCVLKKWDPAWALLGQALASPLLDAQEFNRVKEMMISEAKMRNADPDQKLRNMSMKSAFAGKNYEKSVTGTEAALRSITLEQVIDYFKSNVVKYRMTVVVVGKITQDNISKKVSGLFGGLPGGKVYAKDSSNFVIPQGVKLETGSMTTNYVLGISDAPRPDKKDAIAMKIAMSIMNERLMTAFSSMPNSDPKAMYHETWHPFASFYVTSSNPKETVQLLTDELKKVKTSGFTPQEVTEMKENFLTRHYMYIETNAGQTDIIAQACVNADYKKLDDFVKEVKTVTVEAINSAFKSNIKNMNWSYLGKTDAVDEAAFAKSLD